MFSVVAVSLLVLWWLLVPRLVQNQAFHNFAGDGIFRSPLCCNRGMSNLWNVLSNVPFLGAGFYGLMACNTETPGWLLFCAGSILVCFGSAFYHWSPNDRTLVWDRLPMTLCTVGVVYETLASLNVSLGHYDLLLWSFMGLYSVTHWHLFGDLRLYAFVQYVPVVTILMMVASGWKSMPSQEKSHQLVVAILVYFGARVLEYFDHALYRLTWISGHVWKHLVCALAMFSVLPDRSKE